MNDLNDSTLGLVRGRFLLGMQPEALNYNILCARQVRGYNHRGPAGLCRPERHQESLKVHRQGEGCAQGLSVLGFRKRCRLSLHRHNRVTAPRIVSGCLCTGCRHFQPKWELVGTHTGRRTFIVNALSMGITPKVVMKWTGHSDYKAMKPYIDIVDSIKASSMAKYDGLL